MHICPLPYRCSLSPLDVLHYDGNRCPSVELRRLAGRFHNHHIPHGNGRSVWPRPIASALLSDDPLTLFPTLGACLFLFGTDVGEITRWARASQASGPWWTQCCRRRTMGEGLSDCVLQWGWRRDFNFQWPSFILSADFGGGWRRGRIRSAVEIWWRHHPNHCSVVGFIRLHLFSKIGSWNQNLYWNQNSSRTFERNNYFKNKFSGFSQLRWPMTTIPGTRWGKLFRKRSVWRTATYSRIVSWFRFCLLVLAGPCPLRIVCYCQWVIIPAGCRTTPWIPRTIMTMIAPKNNIP